MKLLIAATTLCMGFAAVTACASDEATAKDAVAIVERGAAFMKAKGKHELIRKINAKDPDFLQGALYVLVRDIKNAVILAHPVNLALVGKDLIDVPDTNGKKYRREEVELAATKGKGWVDYTYKNPATGKVEPKSTYLLRVDDVLVEAGIYKK